MFPTSFLLATRVLLRATLTEVRKSLWFLPFVRRLACRFTPGTCMWIGSRKACGRVQRQVLPRDLTSEISGLTDLRDLPMNIGQEKLTGGGCHIHHASTSHSTCPTDMMCLTTCYYVDCFCAFLKRNWAKKPIRFGPAHCQVMHTELHRTVRGPRVPQ